jgi:hypothetical protein
MSNNNKIFKKELGIEEIFKESYSILSKNIKKIILLLLICYIPFTILFIILDYVTLPDSLFIFLTILLIVSLAIAVIFPISLILLTNDYYNNKKQTITELIKKSSKKLIPVIISFLIIIAVILISYLISYYLSDISIFLFLITAIVMIFFGIKYLVYYFFYMQSIVLKNQSIFDSFKYSKSLVEKRWLNLFFKILTIIILLNLLNYIFDIENIPLFLDIIFSLLSILIDIYIIIIYSVIFINFDNNNAKGKKIIKQKIKKSKAY